MSPEGIKKAVIGGKRMFVILWCVAAIVAVAYLAKPSTGELPTPIVITAMTLIAAMGGVDVWKQGKIDNAT
jgi:Na+/H+ antiporter NhaD/arsenite permease-like protein